MKTAILIIVFAAPASFAAAQQNPADQPPKPPSVRRLAFSPDGKSLAVAHSETNSLAVWDVASRQRKFLIPEKTAIQSIAYSQRGDGLAVAVGNVVKLLDPATGELRRELVGHDNVVRSVSFTADGTKLATSGNDRTTRVWNVATGQTERTFADHKGAVHSAAISPDGKWLSTICREDNAVQLWNLHEPDQPPRKLETSIQSFVPQVVFSPDSRFLVYPSYGATVTFIDVTNGQEYFRLTKVASSYCVAFSPDSRQMALVTQFKYLDLLPFQLSPNKEQQREIAALIDRFHDDDYAKREAASDKLMSFGLAALNQLRAGLESDSAEVRIRCRRIIQRLQNADSAVKLVGHETEPSWAAFSPDGKLLASGDWQGMVKLWDVSDAKVLATLEPE